MTVCSESWGMRSLGLSTSGLLDELCEDTRRERGPEFPQQTFLGAVFPPALPCPPLTTHLLLPDAGQASSAAQACLREGLMAANRHRTQKGCRRCPGAWEQGDSAPPGESLQVLLPLLLDSASSPTVQDGEEAVRCGEMTGSWSSIPW